MSRGVGGSLRSPSMRCGSLAWCRHCSASSGLFLHPLPLLQVGIGSELLPVLLALLLVLLFQASFLCRLLGGNHAAHGVEHFAFAFQLPRMSSSRRAFCCSEVACAPAPAACPVPALAAFFSA